jgi:hypothetical protein
MAGNQIDTTVPHSARIWNYWLGGKDNYPVDREAGDRFLETYPDMVHVARAVRYFLARAVRFLAGEAGMRQFLDVGTGLPTVDNTHEVAQRVNPATRIVYVDNDPLVLAHARALLSSHPDGRCAYVDADVRDPAALVGAAQATLDFGQHQRQPVPGPRPVRRHRRGALPAAQPGADHRVLRRPGTARAGGGAGVPVAARHGPVRRSPARGHLRRRRPQAVSSGPATRPRLS